MLALAIALGFLLDQLLGDPPSPLHPVRWIGALIHGLESPLRRGFAERLAGVILVIVVLGVTGGVVGALLWGARALHPGIDLALQSLLIYLGLAARGLADHAANVCRPLEKGDLPAARIELAKIVGRDTHELDTEQLCRAAVETVAESTTDGVVAPLFFAAIGGPLGLWLFKAISTLDSMVGYRNEPYLRFGWAAARLDDLANFIPARITLMLMPLAAWLMGHDGRAAWRVGRRDGRKHPSPNAGLAEAGMAGALQVQLGGPSTYEGVLSEKPLLGEAKELLMPKKVRQAVAVMLATAWLALLPSAAAAIAIEQLMK